MRNAGWLGFLLWVGCSPAASTGTLSGKVTVDNGSPKGVVVHIEGPTGAGAVTDDTGNFAAAALADGTYAVSATVPGAEVPTLAVSVVVKSAKPDKDAILAFKIPAAVAGAIGGKLTGGSFTGATVSISGPISRGAAPMADGTYSFDKLPAGSYLLTADVLNTLESRQSVVVAVSGAVVAVPDLAFTPVGTFDVVVKTSGGPPAAGARVSVLGQDQNGLTDATGRVTLRRVLVGMRSLSAVLGTSTATTMTAVSQGAGADVTMTLADLPPQVGTVKGVVQFMSSQSAAVILVSTPALTAAVRPDAFGNFTVPNVPAGLWEFYADAPGFPRLKLGFAEVVPGKTTALPLGRMSFYYRFASLPNVTFANMLLAETADFGVMNEGLTGGAALYLVDLAQFVRRPILATNLAINTFAISKNAKWVAYTVSTTPPVLYAADTQTLLSRAAVSQTTLLSSPVLSKDETVLFSVWNDGLHRYDLVTGKDDLFPGAGWTIVNDVAYQNAVTVQMVGTTGTPTTLYTNVTTFSTFPVPWALTDCVGGNCTARILPPGTTTPISLGAVVQVGTNWLSGSTGEYGLFSNGPAATGTQSLVKMSDGTKVTLPAKTFRIVTNAVITGLPATRLAYATTSGANTVLREESLPATGSSAPIATSTVMDTGQYMSATRLIAGDQTAAKVIDVKSGVATTDDATNISVSVQGGALWRKPSNMKIQVTVADSPVVETPLTAVSVAYAFYKGLVAVSENSIIGSSVISVYDGQTLRGVPGFTVAAATGGKAFYATRPAGGFNFTLGLIPYADDTYHEMLELPGLPFTTQLVLTRPLDGAVFVAAVDNAGTASSTTLLAKLP